MLLGYLTLLSVGKCAENARLDILKAIMVTYEHVTKSECKGMTWKDLYRANVFPSPVLLCPKCDQPLTMSVSSADDLKEMNCSMEINQMEYEDNTRKYLNDLPEDKVDLIYKTVIKQLEDLDTE